MDSVAITGWGAFIASVVIFCGSVWLLLAMVLGGRLAYFISASITLAFMLIMGVVWSINTLGPLGELPSWGQTAIGANVQEFGYPEGDWFAPNLDDEEQAGLATEFEGDALDYLGTAIEEGEEGITFEEPEDAVADSEATRLIEQDGTTYGATQLVPNQALEDAAKQDPSLELPDPVTVVMEYDPGNPLGLARQITLGTLILLVMHLFFLGRAERKVKQLPGAEVA